MAEAGSVGNGQARVGEGPARASSGRFIKKHGEIEFRVPDIPGGDFTQRRSVRIQDGIELFLEQAVDSAWESREVLNIRAANYVYQLGLLKRKPSYVTADRWVKQATADADPTCFYKLRYVTEGGYYVLERADWPTVGRPRFKEILGNNGGGRP